MTAWFHDTLQHIVMGLLYPPVEFLIHGGSRFYWLYCATGLMIAAYASRKHSEAQSFRSTLLDKKVWLSASAINDYIIVTVTPVLRFTVLSVLAINWQPVSDFVVATLHSAGVSGKASSGSTYALGIALTLSLFVADDFLKWLTHYTFHAIPELWEFHKVHHSAEVLNFITADRHHPVETIATGALVAVGYGLVNGAFIGLFGDQLTVKTIMGANVFLVVFNICGGALRHSPFWVSFGPRVEKWFISPAMHQIHHSNKPEHFDRNFGGSLSIWDRMAGSLHIPRGREIEGFGIGAETEEFRALDVIFLRPFAKAAAIFERRFKSEPRKNQSKPQSVSA
jgi:sterol desaturase/sphingolipid hydroxylase (fatty acid hydroxylase superfamily)